MKVRFLRNLAGSPQHVARRAGDVIEVDHVSSNKKFVSVVTGHGTFDDYQVGRDVEIVGGVQPSLARMFTMLRVGESVIVTSSSPTVVSAEFARTPGRFTQEQRLVVCPDMTVHKAWLVTRVE